MCLELALASGIVALGSILFGRFEEGTPRWRRVRKLVSFLGITALISATAGRSWALVWVLGVPALGTAFHIWWCRKHGINAWTVEPRDKYYELRGWKR